MLSVLFVLKVIPGFGHWAKSWVASPENMISAEMVVAEFESDKTANPVIPRFKGEPNQVAEAKGAAAKKKRTKIIPKCNFFIIRPYCN